MSGPLESPNGSSTAAATLGSSEAIVEVRGLMKSFGERRVLEGVDFDLRAGENLAILGRSGTGKSVLLKILIGLLSPDGGKVRIWGDSVLGFDDRLWKPVRARMGLVFQGGALFDSMNVFENITGKVREVLDWVGLGDTEEFSPSDLSGGMRKRVALARTMSVAPELILYDEPTTGLDPQTGRRISELMRDLGRRLGSTAVVVTHDVDCAFTVADRWIFLDAGRVVADGTPREILASRVPELRDFLAPWRSLGALTNVGDGAALQ
jgi:phospholipid/cholesterol/gamma-HCH transport system ATP-binding protein